MLYKTSCNKRNNIIRISLNTSKKRVIKSLYSKDNQLIYQQYYFGNSKYHAGQLYLENIEKCYNQGYTITKCI
ncbi:hypothetical protein EDC19_0111 [Natranaerovirga hydrolytica]|uniref:Uncharacterized protein n=1 Tax=Natranaerovirga hydrolytica TaxID=680378 RepID=A0A4R1N247_9FIRM|nr:hypothetical protein [Natranaerovirga hydrolytica]TCK99012.1 hypothetical protein EDC19_0111 [Natranaerovirga hydrolytica]